jgi:AraC family transcriptional regulator
MQRDVARTRVLASSPECDLRLSFYRPECGQPEHAHDVPVVSLVLSGLVGETVGSRETIARSGWVSLKPPGVRHSDGYGRDGALILAVVVRDPALWRAAVARPEWQWRPIGGVATAKIVRQAAQHSGSATEAIADMLAAATEPHDPTSPVPSWLQRVAQRLCEDSSAAISTIAAAEDVHPVHLARLFHRHFGTSPRRFRLAAKTSAAIRLALCHGKSGAAAAYASGFADESHMLRSVKRGTGFRLSELRPLGAL